MKYIFVTGGVISGVGKGTITSSLGVLLKSIGYKVTCIKIDPYINIDAGTIRPSDHGEVYVLDDGAEVDLDLGNYERFLDIKLTKDHNITTGKVYQSVIKKERNGDYLGKTIQIIPHVTDYIEEEIIRVSKIPVNLNDTPEITLIELGGTIGDIESSIFTEAIKRLVYKLNYNDYIIVHVSLIINSGNEQKTKPIQRNIEELRKSGLNPDILFCRNKYEIEHHIREKLSLFCNVKTENIISVKNCNNVYEVPEYLYNQNVLSIIRNKLELSNDKCDDILLLFKTLTSKIKNIDKGITIGLVGKYTELGDSYLSVIKALEHACYHNNLYLDLKMINCENYELEDLNICNGIIVPGGFGERGIEGIIMAIKFSRENNIPFLGICYGFQLAIIEYLRNICNLDTSSSEFNDDPLIDNCITVIDPITKELGGTMKLGSHKIILDDNCELYYKSHEIDERCRHRYEVNLKYKEILNEHGYKFIGTDLTGQRMMISKLISHKFFVGTQYHPEFKSKFHESHPLFDQFIHESNKERPLFPTLI